MHEERGNMLATKITTDLLPWQLRIKHNTRVKAQHTWFEQSESLSVARDSVESRSTSSPSETVETLSLLSVRTPLS
jgi:hypothetical protein